MRVPLLLTWLAVSLITVLTLQAQQQPATVAPAPVASRPQAAPRTPKMAVAYHAAAPEQRAERLSQQLSKQLGLDATTTARVKDAALLRAQKIDAIQTGSDNNKAKNTALQANAQEFKASLKAILTPEQFAKYSTHGGGKPAE